MTNWLARLVGKVGEENAAGASKHARGKQKPKGWRRHLRRVRKVQKHARRANR